MEATENIFMNVVTVGWSVCFVKIRLRNIELGDDRTLSLWKLTRVSNQCLLFYFNFLILCSLVVLHLLDSLDQGTETAAAGTEGVVTLVALHTAMSGGGKFYLIFKIHFTWISYFSLTSVLNSMIGTQGVMKQLLDEMI